MGEAGLKDFFALYGSNVIRAVHSPSVRCRGRRRVLPVVEKLRGSLGRRRTSSRGSPVFPLRGGSRWAGCFHLRVDTRHSKKASDDVAERADQ